MVRYHWEFHCISVHLSTGLWSPEFMYISCLCLRLWHEDGFLGWLLTCCTPCELQLLKITHHIKQCAEWHVGWWKTSHSILRKINVGWLIMIFCNRSKIIQHDLLQLTNPFPVMTGSNYCSWKGWDHCIHKSQVSWWISALAMDKWPDDMGPPATPVGCERLQAPWLTSSLGQ